MNDLQKSSDQTIARLYTQISAMRGLSPSGRLRLLSGYFLGHPYLLGPLGEGNHAPFDQSPLYRTDVFDCLTYVNTILALLFSVDLATFRQNIIAVNYRHSRVAYEQRHHFMSVDWNPENARLGLITDMTGQITDSKGQPLAVISETMIDRPNWFRHRQLSDIKIFPPLDAVEQERRLLALRALGDAMSPAMGRVPYLPLTRLFDSAGQPEYAIFAQIPDAVIIEIVRPNWNLRERIGTDMDVSHLGFGLWEKGQLVFRDASFLAKQVSDTPLVDYLRKYLNDTTIKGINIQRVNIS